MAQKAPQDPLLLEIERLKKPLVGRRLLSWVFFLPTLIVFLAIPVLASLYPAQTKSFFATVGLHEKATVVLDSHHTQKSIQKMAAERAPATPFELDKHWNPGKLASAHAPWANDCKVCHSEAFATVKDKDCLVCHENAGDHVDKKLISVAALDQARCATCHRDHKGELALKDQNIHYTASGCAACHQDIKKAAPKTELKNVQDFADKHPEFKVQIATGVKSTELRRIRLDAGQSVVEKTNLKFPHDIHLANKGIKGPKGKVVMECADCHQPDSTGVSFKNVTMKDHCQSCHELRFEPGLSNRQVPHGSVEDVLNTLREVYSFMGNRSGAPAPVSIESQLRQRPGVESATISESRSPVMRTGGSGAGGAAFAARELFEKTSCNVCHYVSRVAGPGRAGTSGRDLPQYAIAPIRDPHAWMPKARFAHKAHQNESCSDCHNAKLSKTANDVLMPSIETCRDCHVGSSPVVGKITSDCGMCHGFHMDAHQNKNKDQQQPSGPHQSSSIISKR